MSIARYISVAMGQNPVPPVNIPIPTKVGSKMGGASQNCTVSQLAKALCKRPDGSYRLKDPGSLGPFFQGLADDRVFP